MLTTRPVGIGDAFFEREHVGVLGTRGTRPALALFAAVFLRPLARHRLDLTHVEFAGDDFFRKRVGVGFADQHARVAGRELATVNIGLHRVGELEQPQRIGDIASALADDFGDVFLTVLKFVDQRR